MNIKMSSGLRERKIALSLLGEVLDKKQSLDISLEKNKELMCLDPRDRAFTRMLVASALRRLGQCDSIIALALDKGDPKSSLLKNILRLGSVQLFFMDVPDHAAVDMSVELAKAEGMESKASFVNAVMRRLSLEGPHWVKNLKDESINIPQWLLKQWVTDYGLREAAAIAQASLCEASLDISIKDASLKDNWALQLGANILPSGTLRRPLSGSVQNLPGFDDGEWWVQDASAALPAKLLNLQPGEKIIDLCAAPGGKTAQIASAGANVLALDRSAKRLSRLKENMDRLKLSEKVERLACDGAEWMPKEPPSKILLDVPCTSTGTLRRHPDVMHLKTLEDQNRLVETQKRLLNNASQVLMPGGMLIYCTCSLQKAESENQIEAFLAQNPNFKRLPVEPGEVGNIQEIIDANGNVRVLPYHLAAHGGMDGFFISRLAKSA